MWEFSFAFAFFREEGVCFLIFISCLCLFACFLVALDDNGEERR